MRKYRQHSWLSSYFLLQKKQQESSDLETLIKRLSLLDNFIVSIVKLIIFVFFLIFLIILITEILRTEIILDPLSMPEELIKSGYSGTVVAERLLDEARKIEFETNKIINERQSFRSDKEVFKYIGKLTADIQFSDIQIPGANFTIRTLVRYLRQLTPLKKIIHLRGEVIQTENGYKLTLRNISELGIPYVQLTTSENLNKLIQDKGGEALLRISNPSILAIQAYYRFSMKSDVKSEQAEENFRNLKEIIDYCITYAPSTDDALAYTLLADALFIRNPDQAIFHYQKAIKIDSKYIDAYTGLIYIFGVLNRYEEAMIQFKKAIKLDPENANAYMNWGFALEKLNRHDEAKIQYKNAVKYKPEFLSIISAVRKNMLFDKSSISEEAVIQFQKGKLPELNSNYQ